MRRQSLIRKTNLMLRKKLGIVYLPLPPPHWINLLDLERDLQSTFILLFINSVLMHAICWTSLQKKVSIWCVMSWTCPCTFCFPIYVKLTVQKYWTDFSFLVPCREALFLSPGKTLLQDFVEWMSREKCIKSVSIRARHSVFSGMVDSSAAQFDYRQTNGQTTWKHH